ncbi:cation transporter [Luteibacter yeojuensis]
MPCCDCESTGESLARSRAQRRVLWTVLGINVAIFVGEFGAGVWADSTALQGDSLDSLGDALVYAVSLVVVGRSLRSRAGAALMKGFVQLLFAGLVLAEVIHKLIVGLAPLPGVMAVAASLALLGNGACLALLTRFRSHDINMRSVWLCSRNDVIGNAGVLVTTGLIAWTRWPWLDLLFGGALALLFARTGVHVVSAAWQEFRSPRPIVHE